MAELESEASANAVTTDAETPPNVTNVESEVSNGDLPWAIVMLPTTTSGLAGMGENKHQLKVGSWVFGFFADGDSCQQPIVIGTYAGGPGAGTSAVGQSGSSIGVDDGGIAPKPGAANADEVYVKLRSLGYSHVAACGIMGNLQAESGMQPNGKRGDGGSAFGLAQWRGNRWQNLIKFGEAKAGKGGHTDAMVQIEFIHKELHDGGVDSGRGTLAKLQSATTAADAAVAFIYYERPRGYSYKNNNRNADQYANRIAYAKGFDQRFAGKTVSFNTPNAPTSNTRGPR